MISPTLVFSRKSHSATSAAAVTAITNSRYTGKFMKPRSTAEESCFGGSTVRPIFPHRSFTPSTIASDNPNVSSKGSSGLRP